MVEAVLLDLDGTLMDTNYLHVDAWARAFLKVGAMIPRCQIHRQIGKGADQFLPEFLDDPQAREQANKLHGEYYGAVIDQAYLLPGAPELLESLHARGLQLWLTSSAKPAELSRLLARLRGANHLTGVIAAEDVETSKPAGDIYEAALQRAGVDAAAAVAVGDTVWDVIAAKRSGVRTVGVLTGGAYSEADLRAAGAVAVYADCAAMVAAGFPAGL